LAISDFAAVFFPPFDMHVGHLLHERGKVAVAFRAKDPVPMIGKQAIGANPHPAGAQRLFDDSLEGQEVLVLLEKSPSANASIQNMIHHSAGEMTRCV
jgi:hypothetical protein